MKPQSILRTLSILWVLSMSISMVAAAGQPGSDATKRDPRISFFNPDICQADQVVVATVAQRESWRSERGDVRTEVVLRTDISVFGITSSSVELTIAGGDLDGFTTEVAGTPQMRLGSVYALALHHVRGVGGPIEILAYHGVPRDFLGSLPNGSVLGSMWVALCRAHPEGIPANSAIPMSEISSLAAKYGAHFPHALPASLVPSMESAAAGTPPASDSIDQQ